MGPTKILNKNCHNILSIIAQSYIIHLELERLKMCLDTATDMNETTLNTIPGDNFDAHINLGYEKNFL